MFLKLHMSRSRFIAVAALLIAFGWSLWTILRPGEESATPPPSIGDMIGRAKDASDASSPGVRKTAAGDSFTFAHGGRPVTVDLEQVRRSHELLVRQPPASPDFTAVGAPDPDFSFLTWAAREFRGEETIKTRKCWVIEFRKPERTGPHSVVRLYVDQSLGGLMRMQAYDWSGKRALDYMVTAGKKVNGELTAKSAEARHYELGGKRVVEEVEYRLP